jgi:tRNA (guanine-N7-)-methyltransferase
MIGMQERKHREREFGVPIAGEILDRECWARTALKHLPERGPLDWQTLFGRQAPIVVDVGCGNGRFLIGSAVWRPDYDHLGIDVLPLVLRYATRRGNQRGLANLRFAACDGMMLLRKYLGGGSVRELHCYHPQPYHDAKDAHRRLLTPEFLALAQRALEPDGTFFVQTDNGGYWQYLRATVPTFFDFEERDRPWLDAPKGRTRREIIALRRGLPVFRGSGRKRANLEVDEALAMAARLPLPLFDTGPRDKESEALEKE